MGGKEVKETETEILARIKEENKKGIESLKQKMAKEKARTQRISGNLRADNMQRTKIGEPKEGVDYDYYRELLDDDEVNVVMGDETEELLEAMVKEAEDEVKYMKRLYDKGALDPEDFAQGGRAGFFMGSANPRGLGLLRQLLNFFGKKSDVIKNPSDVLREVSNPKAFNKMLEDAKGKVMPKEGIMATDAIKDYQTQMAKDRIDTVKEMLERGKRIKGADDRILAYKNDVKQRFMKDLNMSEADAEKAADRMTTLAMDMTKMEKTPAITDEGVLQLENVLKNLETAGKEKREI